MDFRAGVALCVAFVASCGGEAPAPPPGSTGAIIVGVRSDLRVGVDVDALHVTMTAAGKAYREATFTASSTPKLAFPLELPFAGLPDGTPVSVLLEGSLSQIPGPLVTRLARTSVVREKTLLLPVMLERSCVVIPGADGGLTCAPPETCIHGTCASSEVSPSSLKAYSPTWSQASDVCKPVGAGAPVVVVGQGQSDYLALQEGAVAQVEAGPQGGHHVWVAVRMKNLRQSGSITSVTGHFPDLGLDVGPFNVIFTFDPDEGGYCKLFGLRFQLDQTAPIEGLLGHDLELKVDVKDSDGAVGTGTKLVKLSTATL